MRRLRATKEVFYASKTHKVGEEFDADDGEARILVGIEKAEFVHVEEKKSQVLETRALKAQEEPDQPKPAQEVTSTESAPELTGSRRNRRYMRRDMQAKE